ncbi:MAG TPA: glycoside hydrolase, partial [Acidobacteriaceae bacterium]
MSVSPAHRFVCVHGHFYQPPRENPWLETVETQDSASPYHDWNERITAECYAPNGAARIVDSKNRILRITNNYARMSFNVGPTLLSWMQDKAPLTYAMIRDADRLSQRQFGGHGSAMAQVYNHMIMPLASTRDRETQIVWGIADFEHRYGRKPEGMWLAETAVDLESLDLLARHGIRFTILAPHQCARVRPLSGADAPSTVIAKDLTTSADASEVAVMKARWKETPEASVDTTQPYLVQTSPGHSIAVFFYNGPVSRAIAFDGLLNSGEAFADRLMGGFGEREGAQLVHVATDGESYGHHHRHGEMALAYAFQLIEEGDAKLTNYGQFLANFPPAYEAEIVENSSWSCFHGVERWRSDCGCNGGRPGCNQKWRAPLREALDWLRDSV